MQNYFEGKISYKQLDDNGQQKKVAESHVIEAFHFGEAEKRLQKELEAYVSQGNQLEVVSLKRSNISQIINAKGDEEFFFKAKVNEITVNEKSGKEKKSSWQALIRANDIDDAKEKLTDFQKGTMSDWELGSISETPIIDVFLK